MSLQFYEVQHIYVLFSLVLLMSQKPLSTLLSWRLTQIFSFELFYSFSPYIKDISLFGWIIIYGVRQGVQQDFLSISLSYCSSTVCAERILFPHWIILTLFSKINWPKILAAATAKSLQSCPTLCDPIDGSPPGCPVPGTLQARTGVGCHFLLQCMKVKSESEVAQSCPTLHDSWTAAYQAPPSMGFSRQEYWNGVPLPSPNTTGVCSESLSLFCCSICLLLRHYYTFLMVVALW